MRSYSIFLLAMLGCVSSCTTPSTPLPSANATPTVVRGPSIFSTATPARGIPTTPTAVATKASDLAVLVLRWESGVSIADIDDVSEMAIHLREKPGIIDAFGDEIQITITYDPKRITPEAIQRTLSDMGYPAKKP